MDSILKVYNIKKSYGNGEGKVQAVNDVSFEIEDGDFVGIMGQSGCGKTTLINIISTIDKASSGKIIFDNKEISSFSEGERTKFRKNSLGFIFQDFKLLDNLTIEENIAIPLVINKWDKKIIKSKVNEIASVVSVENLLNKYPFQLFGGAKQRVACCRAIITNPKLILADEPTGSLDSENSENLLNLLKDINKNIGSTIITVTHDVEVASNCSKIILMKDGKIYSQLTNMDYKDENNNNRDFTDIILKKTLEMRKNVVGGEYDK